MNTKQKGTLAEQAAVLEGMRRGWGVLQPVGDYLPYDLVYDVEGQLFRVQVKSAWYNADSHSWLANARRSQTNRKVYKYTPYTVVDFEVALVYLDQPRVFYVIPAKDFVEYKSAVTMMEDDTRRRSSRSAAFREAWEFFMRV